MEKICPRVWYLPNGITKMLSVTWSGRACLHLLMAVCSPPGRAKRDGGGTSLTEHQPLLSFTAEPFRLLGIQNAGSGWALFVYLSATLLYSNKTGGGRHF